MDIRNEIIKLGHQLSEESNAAHDLWTWLPSHRAAEKYHGDYASEFRPSVDWVMKEASNFLADLKNHREVTEESYPCPCDEHVEIPTEKVLESLANGITVTEISADYEVEPFIIENIIEFARREEFYGL